MACNGKASTVNGKVACWLSTSASSLCLLASPSFVHCIWCSMISPTSQISSPRCPSSLLMILRPAIAQNEWISIIWRKLRSSCWAIMADSSYLLNLGNKLFTNATSTAKTGQLKKSWQKYFIQISVKTSKNASIMLAKDTVQWVKRTSLGVILFAAPQKQSLFTQFVSD